MPSGECGVLEDKAPGRAAAAGRFLAGRRRQRPPGTAYGGQRPRARLRGLRGLHCLPVPHDAAGQFESRALAQSGLLCPMACLTKPVSDETVRTLPGQRVPSSIWAVCAGARFAQPHVGLSRRCLPAPVNRRGGASTRMKLANVLDCARAHPRLRCVRFRRPSSAAVLTD